MEGFKVDVCRIQFRKVGKKYYFNPNGIAVKDGNLVVVETVRGLEIGEVSGDLVKCPKELEKDIKPILRIATKKDLDNFAKNIESLLNIIYEDIVLYRIILSDDYLMGYFRSVEQTYEKNISSFLNIKSNKAKQIFRYMMSGFGGILTDWMIRHTLPVDETAKIIAKLALENIYYLTEENKQ